MLADQRAPEYGLRTVKNTTLVLVRLIASLSVLGWVAVKLDTEFTGTATSGSPKIGGVESRVEVMQP